MTSGDEEGVVRCASKWLNIMPGILPSFICNNASAADAIERGKCVSKTKTNLNNQHVI